MCFLPAPSQQRILSSKDDTSGSLSTVPISLCETALIVSEASTAKWWWESWLCVVIWLSPSLHACFPAGLEPSLCGVDIYTLSFPYQHFCPTKLWPSPACLASRLDHDRAHVVLPSCFLLLAQQPTCICEQRPVVPLLNVCFCIPSPPNSANLGSLLQASDRSPWL